MIGTRLAPFYFEGDIMDNIQKETEKGKKSIHPRIRRELDDFYDGANVTHYLGNTDYSGSNLPDPYIGKNEKLDGKEAQGNDLDDEDFD
jgi:hypothetical protein